MTNATRMIGAAALLLAGCTSSSTPTVDPSTTADQPPRLEKVTFHVTRMNERLQIL